MQRPNWHRTTVILAIQTDETLAAIGAENADTKTYLA